jgi:hypothetical protein
VKNAGTLREVIRYAAAFASTTALAVNTNEQIVAPASNVNGLIVWAASVSSSQAAAGGDSIVGLLAKASAPASSIDGDVLLTLDVRCQTSVGGGLSANVALPRPIFVPAGKGLYFRNGAGLAETVAYRSALYSLL